MKTDNLYWLWMVSLSDLFEADTIHRMFEIFRIFPIHQSILSIPDTGNDLYFIEFFC